MRFFSKSELLLFLGCKNGVERLNGLAFERNSPFQFCGLSGVVIALVCFSIC
jgi:hypothetical protein